MPDYKVPLREYRYVLHEVLGAEAHYRSLGREDVNAELIEGVLEGAARFAEDVVAPTNEPGDRIGVRRTEDGRVVTPPGFVEAYRQYVGDGWASLCGPVHAGGQGLPESIGGVVGEMLVSANMSWKLYSGLTDSAVLALATHGTDEMKRVYLPKLVSGVWSGTMVLTEPHAGTDLGLMRTRAEPEPDGSYRVTGTKIFITSGEHDLTENIVHLVLAKLPEAPRGSRGISMFLVPKLLPDAAGAPGQANGVSCSSVEHKLGIHGSATCVMNFDASRGWLIGEVNGGLRNMFTMMNHARLWVGLQGLAQCERGWQASVAYARERRQGRTSAAGRAPADPIIGHPDVRRMLLTQKALVEGARVLTWYAAQQMDRSLHHPDTTAREQSAALLSVLTPIVKGFVTGMSLECTSEAIQVHGGHGYVRETGVEQFFRDARITMIYEGANGIQAVDLLGRKVLGSGGALARQLGGLIGGFCERHAKGGEHAEYVARLAGLLKEWSVATEEVARRAARNPDETGAAAMDYLQLTGYLCLAWCWAWMATVSAAALKAGTKETAFHRAKLSTARYYFQRMLPRAEAHLDAMGAGARSLMEIPPDQFAF
ncbi:MAG TPA: acyl-CoA dehydrogenase C-terminal domain-containing protein [Steroidobacteraceae bacterium]|jgi:alkylation response protein AidB-like acyl-CoA dehydrogenase|nr:acyl-CoA dehydrogenase C-terminal domain-containing protein [Steroidobacteraceae bacterium]